MKHRKQTKRTPPASAPEPVPTDPVWEKPETAAPEETAAASEPTPDVPDAEPEEVGWAACPICAGTGMQGAQSCPACHGSGMKNDDEEAVEVP